MKSSFTLFFCFISILVFSQNDEIEENIRINERLKNFVEENNRVNEAIRIQNEINRLDRNSRLLDEIDNSQTNQPITKQELPEIPEGIHPENNTFFNNSIEETPKPSFENRVYDVEKHYKKDDNGEYSLNEEYRRNDFERFFNVSNNSTLSLSQKLLRIIMIVFGWFILGFILNFIFYSNTPEHLVGKSETARYFHIIINIITASLILQTICL